MPHHAPHAATVPPPRWRVWLLDETEHFARIFIYLWVLFGLFSLHETIIRGEMGQFALPQGLAFINALVLGKVMLVAENLRVGRGSRARPLIVVVLREASLFALLFLSAHILEDSIRAVLNGSTLLASLPSLGSTKFWSLIIATGIMFVALIPYFAFRDLSEVLGAGRLRALLFAPIPAPHPAGQDK